MVGAQYIHIYINTYTMFILRHITKKHFTSNMSLGNRYSVVKKEEQPEEFKESLGVTDHHPDSDSIFAIIHYHDGDKHESFPLYEGHHYYIMTPSGETFERIRK